MSEWERCDGEREGRTVQPDIALMLILPYWPSTWCLFLPLCLLPASQSHSTHVNSALEWPEPISLLRRRAPFSTLCLIISRFGKRRHIMQQKVHAEHHKYGTFWSHSLFVSLSLNISIFLTSAVEYHLPPPPFLSLYSPLLPCNLRGNRVKKNPPVVWPTVEPLLALTDRCNTSFSFHLRKRVPPPSPHHPNPTFFFFFF